MTAFASDLAKPLGREYSADFTARQYAQSRQLRPPPVLRTLHCASVPGFRRPKQSRKIILMPLSDWLSPPPPSHPGWLYQAPGKEQRNRPLRVLLLLSTVLSSRFLPLVLASPTHSLQDSVPHENPPSSSPPQIQPDTPAPHPAPANTPPKPRAQPPHSPPQLGILSCCVDFDGRRRHGCFTGAG